MPEIPGLPDHLVGQHGVEMMPPPAQFLEQTNTMIHDAVAKLGPGDKFMTAWVLTSKGVNSALVTRVNDHIEIVGYIGKSWGAPIEAGIGGVWHF